MSTHKLSEGDGYAYYERQIATNDSDVRGNMTLDDYFSEAGEVPGHWYGPGLGGLGTINAGDRVTGRQNRAFFGAGMHPDADEMIARRRAELLADGARPKDATILAERSAMLGRPYGKYAARPGSFRRRLAAAYGQANLDAGRDWLAPVPEQERARIRTEIATRMMSVELGRAPKNDTELSGWIARNTRETRKAVAAFDLTFTPVKSVSTLWALAPRDVAARIEAAHRAAVADAIEFLGTTAIYSRLGRGGVRQVDTDGLIIAWYDHRDSRAGDPNLHSHLVTGNRVRVTSTGQWRTLDARMIYKFKVAASEVYNTRSEMYLAAMGVRFADRAAPDGKRTVREIVGIDPGLCEHWSKREAAIRARTAELTAKFQADHGREPMPDEVIELAQTATLATRPHKHEPRSYQQQRQTWRAEATEFLGSTEAVDAMVRAALNTPQTVRRPVINKAWIERAADQALATVSATRATWQLNHVRAEAERIVRGRVDLDDWQSVVKQVVTVALSEPRSLTRAAPAAPPAPGVLARRDGASVYTVAHTTRYTSRRILEAEARLVAAALRHDGYRLSSTAVDTALVEYAANHQGRTLNEGQAAMVRAFATSGIRLQLGIAPAGTGKTTSMQVLTRAWLGEGGQVLGLAPTAAAAAVLAGDVGVQCHTIDKLVATLHHADADPESTTVPQWVHAIGRNTLAIIDEAAKASTLNLDAAVTFLLQRGAVVRGIGDDRQLSAVAAGGVVRDIVAAAGAASLTEVMRFADPAERAASLALREGDPAALAFYADTDRLHVGTLGSITDQAYRAWAADVADGVDAILLAPTRDIVDELNHRARTERLATEQRPGGREARLASGLSAGRGDVILSRRNDSRLRLSDTDYVRNGYRWQVVEVRADGAIRARHLGTGRGTILPADYVASNVDLGYATTIDTSQGVTVTTCHGVLTGHETRNQAYVMLTRGRDQNHAYIATGIAGTEGEPYRWETSNPESGIEVMTTILGREGSQESATTVGRRSRDARERLALIAPAYLDAIGVVAEHIAGATLMARIADAATELVPGIDEASAWPLLHQHLATLALSGHDPIIVLQDAIDQRELDTADDPAAVLDWRLDPTGAHSHTQGPLPWLPAVPDMLVQDPTYGAYLLGQAYDITSTAGRIVEEAGAWTGETAPLWAQPLLSQPELVGRLAVWRAAHNIPDQDRRPTGPRVRPVPERRVQQALDEEIVGAIGDLTPDTRRWATLAERLDPRLTRDPYWPLLAQAWTEAATGGVDVRRAVRRSVEADPLPDQMPAAALRWRLTRDPVTLAPVPALPNAQHDPTEQVTQAAGVSADTGAFTSHLITQAMPGALPDPQPQNQRTPSPEPVPQHLTVAAVTDRHRADTATAALIDTARQAHAALSRLITRAGELDDAVSRVQRRLGALTWWQESSWWGPRDGLRRELDDLHTQRRTVDDAHLAATKASLAAAKAVPAPPDQWEAILDRANDATARATELHAARERESIARAVERARRVLAAGPHEPPNAARPTTNDRQADHERSRYRAYEQLQQLPTTSRDHGPRL